MNPLGERYAVSLYFTGSVSVILWASAFVGIRAALRSYSPGELALVRFFVASMALVGYGGYVRMPLPLARDLPGIILLGVTGVTIYNLALNYGEVRVTAGIASFIVGTVPIWTGLISRFLLQESIGLARWMGTAVSMFGLTVIALTESVGLRPSLEVLAILVAAVSQALFFVLQRPLLTRYTPLQLTTYCIAAGTIPLGFVAGDAAVAVSSAALADTLAVVYLGVFPGAAAYLAWAYVLSRIPPGRAARFLYCVPPVAMLLGWVWLDEIPTATSILGGVLAIGGVVIGLAKWEEKRNPRSS